MKSEAENMYVKHNNPIAIRSQRMISEALFRLMQKEPYHVITITQICQEAEIARKTFYRNFETKEDILDFQLDELYEEYVEELSQVKLEDRLYHYFAFMKKHVKYLAKLYGNNLLHFLIAKFAKAMPEIMPLWTHDPVEQQYRSAYITAGIEAILRVWAERGFEESIDDIMSFALHSLEKQEPITRL